MSESMHESLNKKKGLGRGLGSLLGSGEPKNNDSVLEKNSLTQQNQKQMAAVQHVQAPAPIDPEQKIWKVAIDKLSSGQYQPRQSFNKETLAELSQSIKESGILQPIVARRTASGKLEIIAGERRWRAAQLAGLHEVPVILKSFDDKQALELALIENIQREDLNPIEEAEGFSRLVSEFKLSQQQVAEKVGKDRATVANSLRLLGLPVEVRQMIFEGKLSTGHAKAILANPDPKKQIEFAKKTISEKIPVRKLEKLVQSSLKVKEDDQPLGALNANVTDRLISELADQMQKIMGTRVSIDYLKSKGKINIHFYSDDELTNLVDRLKRGWQ